MSTVLDQAQNFSGGPIAAARQRDRWARQEANSTDDERRESYREAIADLEARYPDIAEVPIGGAEAFARERGHGTGKRSPVHEGRRRSGAGGPARTGKESKGSSSKTPPAGRGEPKPIPGLTPGAKRAPSQRKAATGRSTPRVDRAIRQTGIPAAASSTQSTLMAGLGATVGLGLLFLVLDSAESRGSGAAAVPRIVNGVGRAVGRFLSLGDVFPSNTGVGGIALEGPNYPAGATLDNPHAYNEGPGSNIAGAARRLKGARRRAPAGDYTYAQRLRRGEVAGPPTPRTR